MANPTRILAAEMTVTILGAFIVDLAQLHRLPSADQVIGLVGAFGILAAVAMFGEQPTRLAAGIGGLITFSMMMGYASVIVGGISTASTAGSSQSAPVTTAGNPSGESGQAVGPSSPTLA